MHCSNFLKRKRLFKKPKRSIKSLSQKHQPLVGVFVGFYKKVKIDVALRGQRYLKQNFNKITKTVFNVDSFGHAGAIPQILKKSQIDNYCMCSPENHHFEISSPYFYWQSKDGKKLPSFNLKSNVYSVNLAC